MRGIVIKDSIMSIDLQDVDVTFDLHQGVFSISCTQKPRSLVDELKRNSQKELIAQSYVGRDKDADDILDMIRTKKIKHISEFQKHLDEHLK